MKVVIEILEGARQGERLTFEAPRTLRFGRHPDNEVAFDANVDRDASARHAELRLARGGYRLFDLSSANGTIVDGRRLDPDGLAIDVPTEVCFGAAGPRCRVTVVGDGEVVPETLNRTPVEAVASTAAASASTPLPGESGRLEAGRSEASRAATPAGSRRFGAKTVAGIVDEALRRSRSGQRRVVFAALGFAVIASGVGVALALRSRPESLRKELAVLVSAQSGANDTERAELQKRIDQLAHKLGRGVEIVKANRRAVFLVVARDNAGSDGFCTAFAVGEKRLLTNAHCVQLADELRRKGNRIELVPNGGGPARAVVGWKKSAGFRASHSRIGVDVGWLAVDEALPDRVTLATKDVAEAVAAGDTMSTYGFPGRLADTGAPEATYVAGVIGRVTTLDGRPGAPSEQQLLQHSAFTSAGTSGSPLFDAEGRVIGINAGGYVDDGAAGRPLPGYNFGMRIDLASTLLNEADE